MIDHVLLTRFNLPSKGLESFVRASYGWTEQRVRLFEQFCLPSVIAQTDRRFRWIVYFDPDSPEWLKEWIDSASRDGNFTPKFRVQVTNAQKLEDIASQFDTRHEELLTTNLDNDDALAVDFVERLHSEEPPAARTAYYFPNGLIRSGAKVYTHRDPANAFVSIRETWDSPITCWGEIHHAFPRHLAVRHIGGGPGWMQVVHGRNVSNKIRGRLVDPEAYRYCFDDLLDDLAPPAAVELAFDRVLAFPARVGRDAVLRTVRIALVASMGHSRVDRLKLVVRTGAQSIARLKSVKGEQLK